MPGKDFEQQVRETMGPWRLEPSGEVWGRLEAGLQRKKKRRRAFYVFLLAGLLTGAALMRYGFVETGTGGQELTQQVPEMPDRPSNQAPADEERNGERRAPVENVEPGVNRRYESPLTTKTQTAPLIPGKTRQANSLEESRGDASATLVQAPALSKGQSVPEAVADDHPLSSRNNAAEAVADARTVEQGTGAMPSSDDTPLLLMSVAGTPGDHRSFEDPFPVMGIASDINVSALSIPAPAPDQPVSYRISIAEKRPSNLAYRVVLVARPTRKGWIYPRRKRPIFNPDPPRGAVPETRRRRPTNTARILPPGGPWLRG